MKLFYFFVISPWCNLKSSLSFQKHAVLHYLGQGKHLFYIHYLYSITQAYYVYIVYYTLCVFYYIDLLYIHYIYYILYSIIQTYSICIVYYILYIFYYIDLFFVTVLFLRFPSDQELLTEGDPRSETSKGPTNPVLFQNTL